MVTVVALLVPSKTISMTFNLAKVLLCFLNQFICNAFAEILGSYARFHVLASLVRHPYGAWSDKLVDVLIAGPLFIVNVLRTSKL